MTALAVLSILLIWLRLANNVRALYSSLPSHPPGSSVRAAHLAKMGRIGRDKRWKRSNED